MGTHTPRYPSGLPIGAGWRTDLDNTPIHFPFDGTVVGQAPVGQVRHAADALDAGVAVVPAIGKINSGTRRTVLLAVAEELNAHSGEIIDLLIAETGKPRVDCEVEFSRTLFTWSAAAEEVSHIHGETVPLDMQASGSGMIGFWTRRPIGLVIGVAGFNYPLLLASHKIAPAIAAGCPVICKPAPATPLATLWLADMVRRVAARHDVPAEIIQVVTGDAEVGRVLVSDDRVGAVSFTGSAAVGHQIARDAAPRKTLLELGSNAALIVDDSADLDGAVDAVIRGGFYGNGQACISIQRVLVCAAVADDFVNRLAARMGEVVVGDPRDPLTRVAPLVNDASTQRVLEWIASAEQAGAKVLHGGALAGRTIEPTVLIDVPVSENAWCQEIFGPVVAIRRVADIDEAISAVNESRYGLQASIFTGSLAVAFRALDELHVGGVIVNEVPGFRSDIMPYGGVKDSGIGREGPRFAIEELTVTRMAIIRPGKM